MADLDQINTVRLLIADTGTDKLLDDMALGSLIDLNTGRVRLAAADALEVIATSELLVAKKIRTQTLTTDGPAVSAELRALADRHRRLAQDEDDTVDDGVFDIVDTITTCARPEFTEHEVWGL